MKRNIIALSAAGKKIVEDFNAKEAGFKAEVEKINRRRNALHLETWGALCDEHDLGDGTGWELQDVHGTLILVNRALLNAAPSTRH